MRFQTYRRVKRGAVTAFVLVPVAAVGALLLPANAQEHKIKEPGKVMATWSSSTSGVTTMPYRTVWDASARGRNMPAGYHGAVVIQRLSHSGWKSGMELTPAGANELGVNILKQLHSDKGSIQIWNHFDHVINRTDMHFAAPEAYGVAIDLIQSSGGH
jgi:hypothetical protein